MHLLVVSINNLRMTNNLVRDLSVQTHPYSLTLIDNAGNEDLCRLWNKFFLETSDPHLCFLNNDVRVPPNFVADTMAVLGKEPSIGCIVHEAGDLVNYLDNLEYRVPEKKFCQGWEFTIRREAYTVVPDNLKVFGGDDYIFSNLYLKGWRVAVITSSPIIHYNARSRKWYKYDRNEEMKNYLQYGYDPLPHGAHHVS
jgi:hypothetical protein